MVGYSVGSLASSGKKPGVYTLRHEKEGYLFSGREFPSFEKQVLVSYQTHENSECQVMGHQYAYHALDTHEVTKSDGHRNMHCAYLRLDLGRSRMHK